MSIAEQKKRMTMTKRIKLTIVIAAILVAIMSVALVFVYEYVRTTEVVDPADNSVYYVMYKDKTYALYDTDKKTKRPTDSQYGYYVTRAETLIEVDPETGEYTIQAVLADYGTTDGNEVVGFNFRRLLFPHIEKKNIRSLEVHNETGTYTFARVNENGDYRANVTNGGTMYPYTPTKEEVNLAIKACKATKCDFAGVDLLFSDNGPIVCEVNSNAHLRNVYLTTNIDVTLEIVKYISNSIYGGK